MQRADLARLDLPDTTGVYFFMHGKAILYIGKATSLRDRVRSYFSTDLAAARSPAIVAMVGKADHVRFQECDSVLEALIVEANLIKKHQPPFNVDEKDNKSWNYLIVTREEFPRVIVVRGRELFDPTNELPPIKHTFGPYPQGGSLREALKIVRKIFPFRDTCTPAVGKPCFNAQIGLCPGVCSGAMSAREYARTVKSITELFGGNFKGLKRRLAREMKTAAAAERFEEASILRRQVHALEHIRDVSLIKDDVRVVSGGSIRIEAYDVAHMAGKETVGVMTVVEGGEAQTQQYRKFTIRTAANDDVASLGEMLERRLAHAEWPYPRIIVVDGALPQLRRAQKILKSAGLSIPIVGVVKDDRHKPDHLIGDMRSRDVYEKDILLANAEAHRFAIGWHRTRVRKKLIS